jgi:hypothetical protein
MKRQKKTVRAQEFILEDEDGMERAALRMDSAQNASLLFRDPGGNIKLHAGVSADGTPRVDLHYSAERGVVRIEASDQSNIAALTITGPNGTIQVAIGVARNGTPVLALLDEEGSVVFPPEAAKAGADLARLAEDNDWRELLDQ